MVAGRYLGSVHGHLCRRSFQSGFWVQVMRTEAIAAKRRASAAEHHGAEI